MDKKTIELSDKQKFYLIKLRKALNCEYNDLKGIDGIEDNFIELKQLETFLIRVIQNGHYHYSSKEKINNTTSKFNYLIKKWGI